MSGTLTTGFRKRMLQHVFSGTALGFTDLQVALTKRVPSANSSPSQLDEPVGLAYARQTLALGSWANSISGEVGNPAIIYFPVATGTWGVLNGWALVTVEATPIVAAVGQLVTPYRVISGIRPYIPILGLAVGLYD